MCRRPSESDRLLGFCVQHPPRIEKFIIWIGIAYAAFSVIPAAVAW